MVKTLRVTVCDVLSESGSPAPRPRTFRLPSSAYLSVVILLFCTFPIALAGEGTRLAPAVLSFRLLLLLVPVIAAVFIRRTATIVDTAGITVRAAFGSRVLRWEDVHGLSVSGRAVYAVLFEGGSVRLPCVTVADLAAVAKASGDRLPEIAEPKPKYAPQRRSRR
jgi:Bacterial PH domain